MVPLNYILRKCTGDSKFTKSQEMFNHRVYMNDIKLFAEKEKELETRIQTVIYSWEIGMEFGIEKFTMLMMKSGKKKQRKEENCGIWKVSKRLERRKITISCEY